MVKKKDDAEEDNNETKKNKKKLSLKERLMSVGSIEGEFLSESDTLDNVDMIKTEIPIINIAFSAEVDKGFTTGLTVVAGMPATFKCCDFNTPIIVYEDVKKIETTYGNLFNIVKDYPDRIFYIKKPDGELTKINAVCEKSIDQMYEIEFNNGYKIKCANKHVLMDRTGKPIFVENLKHNSRVLTVNGTISVKYIKKVDNKLAYDISIDAPYWYINDDVGLIHHNTLLGLYCLRSYFKKYPEAFCLFYNSEWGVTKKYLESMEIDISRVLHLPLVNLEELTQDIRQKLEEIEEGEKVFIFIDSIGNTASVKEATDALAGKSVQDMSRPKAIKSLFRIITPHLAIKKLPCVAINHVYKSQGDYYPVDIVSGGTGSQYSSNQIFIITKAQEKNAAKELIGQRFTININKSRFVKYKSQFPFVVLTDTGIAKWSGLDEIAKEGGFIKSSKKGYVEWTNPETGEVKTSATNSLDTNDDFWQDLVYSDKFKNYVRDTYQLGTIKMIADDKSNVK